MKRIIVSTAAIMIMSLFAQSSAQAAQWIVSFQENPVCRNTVASLKAATAERNRRIQAISTANFTQWASSVTTILNQYAGLDSRIDAAHQMTSPRPRQWVNVKCVDMNASTTIQQGFTLLNQPTGLLGLTSGYVPAVQVPLQGLTTSTATIIPMKSSGVYGPAIPK